MPNERWGVTQIMILLLLAATVCVATATGPAGDKVSSLPGLPSTPSSALWSGLLSATASGQKFKTHYMFTESQDNPAHDPLVLWQQGGPGSSGLGYGWLAELGPYRLTANSLSTNTTAIPRMFTNPHSFDRISNLLVLEHPPGTGFSYW